MSTASAKPTGPPPVEEEPRGTLGPGAATALIVGSIIGVGIFNLPASLAGYGPISLIAMALTTVGALALAVMFASLSRRLPADGGPYAYARAAFGNMAGFSNAWLYWITAWSGNAAIVVGWVLYVEEFVNEDQNKLFSIALALVGLWLPAAINLRGVGAMGAVQLWTSILKFIPLVFMSTVGLFYIDSANFEVWNTSGDSAVGAIGGAMALCLFSYLGVECAAVAAAKVRDPDKNVGRATIFGTLGTAVVYLLSLTAVFGIVSAASLSESTAPFATAVNEMVGGTWAGYVMSALVVVSGFGALNGWTMICAEMPLAAAKDGLFPHAFGRLNGRGVPAVGIIASTALASVFMIMSYAGSVGITVFNTLVYMSGITAAIPYAFSALAQIKWRLVDHRELHTPRFVRDVGIAAVGLVFSVLFIWYSRNTGEESTWKEYLPFIFAGGAFAAGIPIYLRHRHSMSEPPPVPAWRA
ncbi:amino acid permease [Blastococcus sp. URHD0036]|uniref:amino acid permease n=1 Tax=Blastococcus sp. URHD0036 TaxID=1380356 RepID=UPI00049604C7|nr:amino acid permease [Blastococcus sp. URHD0036]